LSNPYLQPIVRCAGPNCGQIKRETNFWYIVRIFSDQFILNTWNWELLASYDNAAPLCSEACASKMLSKFMSDHRQQSQKEQFAAQGGPPS
jgi:hypothetical protein